MTPERARKANGPRSRSGRSEGGSGGLTTRPTPIQAAGQRHADLMARLAARDDRFSQLLATVRDQPSGFQTRTKHGFSKEIHAELESLKPEAHRRFRREIEDSTAKLRGLLSRVEPMAILARVRALNLVTVHGGYFEPTHQGLESNVELVAGLLLTQPPPLPGGLPDAGTLDAIVTELRAHNDLLLLLNLSAPTGDDPSRGELRASGALHWMTVRGTSYAHHGMELAQRVYRPFDRRCFDRYGFTVDDVLNLGEVVEALTGPFTREDLDDSGLDMERVDAVLRELSVSPGALDASAYTGVFDKSPLVEHPFFEVDGRFLLVIPGMVLRDTIELLERRLASADPKFSDRRARALDALAVEHLQTLLPGSMGHTNLFYEHYELDGLVVFERIALIVEGKATPLSVPAQRGDLNRLERDVSRSVQHAWEQGARARDYLMGGEDAVFRDKRGGEIVRIPAGSIDEVLIINPTLHQLAGHASQLPRLRKLGLFAAEEFPWSVFINDLRVIAETSDNAAVFLHYLSWRARLPLGDEITVADEIDLWASYLMGERFGALADGVHITVGNSCTDFDAYYDGLLDNGPPHPRPGKLLGEPVTEFVDRMARDRPAGWLQAAGVCLDLSVPELSFACGSSRRLWREANQLREAIVDEVGRVQLVALPKGWSVAPVREGLDADGTEATLRIFITGSKAKRGQILWAEQLKPVTFELSDYEQFMYAQAAALF